MDRTSVETAKIYQAALLGIVAWDWVMSLKSEYRHIWKGEFSLTKVLYFVARYVCLALTTLVFVIQFVDLPLERCHAFVRANCMALTVVQVTSISVLTQRVWAVLTHRTWRYWVIGILVLLDLATLIFGIFHAAMAVVASPDPMVNGRGFCQIRVHHNWMGFTAAFFAMPILAHTIATAAVAYAVNPLPDTNAVKRLLLVDGVVYMIGVNTIGVLQLVFFYQTMSDNLRMLNSAALLSLTAVFCCRLMLHLREQAEEINKYPFGRSPDSSRTAKSDNKLSFFKRISSAKPSNSTSGTVSILSQPENSVRPPVHHVTVVHEVEQMSSA